AEVVVHTPEDFERWLDSERRGNSKASDSAPLADEVPSLPGNLAQRGRQVAAEQGCFKCHTVDGTRHIGPSFLGLYGRDERIEGNKAITVNEAYMTESMM